MSSEHRHAIDNRRSKRDKNWGWQQNTSVAVPWLCARMTEPSFMTHQPDVWTENAVRQSCDKFSDTSGNYFAWKHADALTADCYLYMLGVVKFLSRATAAQNLQSYCSKWPERIPWNQRAFICPRLKEFKCSRRPLVLLNCEWENKSIFIVFVTSSKSLHSVVVKFHLGLCCTWFSSDFLFGNSNKLPGSFWHCSHWSINLLIFV